MRPAVGALGGSQPNANNRISHSYCAHPKHKRRPQQSVRIAWVLPKQHQSQRSRTLPCTNTALHRDSLQPERRLPPAAPQPRRSGSHSGHPTGTGAAPLTFSPCHKDGRLTNGNQHQRQHQHQPLCHWRQPGAETPRCAPAFSVSECVDTPPAALGDPEPEPAWATLAPAMWFAVLAL